MIKRFDHLTIVVRDIADAKRFFGLLGFEEAVSVVISGEVMAKYMGVAGIEIMSRSWPRELRPARRSSFCTTGIRA